MNLQEMTAELVHDGDETVIGDWTLRLTIGPDEYASVIDDTGEGTWFGRLDWARRDPDRSCYTRPEWADGGAELLRAGFFDRLWWRPDADVVRDRELRDRLRRDLLMTLEYGYSVVVIEAWRHRDLYGRGCVEAVASLGGVASWGDDFAFIVQDVVAEVLGQIEEVDA
jgi:hypothetical protein